MPVVGIRCLAVVSALFLAAGCGSSPDLTAAGDEIEAAVQAHFDRSAAGAHDNVRAVLVTVGGQTAVERYYDIGLPSHADEAVDVVPEGDWMAPPRGGTVQPPGEGFSYSNDGSHLLSAILAQATGRSVLDYAREVLFTPLGIDADPAAPRRTSTPKRAGLRTTATSSGSPRPTATRPLPPQAPAGSSSRSSPTSIWSSSWRASTGPATLKRRRSPPSCRT